MEHQHELCESFSKFCDWLNGGLEMGDGLEDVIGERAMLLPVYFAAFSHIYAGIDSSAYAASFYNRLHMGRTLAEVRQDGHRKVPVDLLLVRDKLDAFLVGHPAFRDFLWGECIVEEDSLTAAVEAQAYVDFVGSVNPMLATYAARGTRPHSIKGDLYNSQPPGSLNLCHFALGVQGMGEVAADARTIVAAAFHPSNVAVLHVWRATPNDNAEIGTESYAFHPQAEVVRMRFPVLAISIHQGVIICGCADGGMVRIPAPGMSNSNKGAWSNTSNVSVSADPQYPLHAVWAVAFAPMGYMWATAGTRGRVCVWTEDSCKQPVRILLSQMDATTDVSALAWGPTGRFLFGASARDMCSMWDLQRSDIEPMRRFAGYATIPTSLSVNSDGTKLAASSCDGRIIVWDVHTGKLAYKWHDPMGAPTYSATWNGPTLAACCGSNVLSFFMADLSQGPDLLQCPSQNVIRAAFVPHPMSLVLLAFSA